MTNRIGELLPTYEVQVGDKGTLALSPELQVALGVQPGDTLTFVKTEAGMPIIPPGLIVPELARQLSRWLTEKGLTLEAILQEAKQERKRLFKEKYERLAAP